MHYSRIALAVTPAIFACVSAYGSAIVKNSCGEDVYFWSCGDTPGDMITVAAGNSYPQGYYSKNDGGGISLKIGVKYPSGPKVGQIPGVWDLPAPNMTQFEYTVGTPGPPSNAVFYDISNINGYPFVEGGLKMTSSDGSVNVACPKGVQYCQAAYNAPHDDHATGSAADHVDLTLELCSDAPGMTIGGGSAGSGKSNEGSAPQQPSSTPVAPSSQPTTSHAQSQPQVVAPEKLAVKPVNQPPTTTSSTPPPSITPTSTEEEVIVWSTVSAPPVVVTVHAGQQKEKRHDHVHQHVHNKINKKRHGN